jgi:predicted NUDIX family NTP pyrophosphohydrolase
MTTRRSAGILLFGRAGDDLEVLLGHMGGPFWARRDAGAWTIPKGEHGEQESAWDAARREFVEELGLDVPAGEPLDLGEVRQSGGKVVRAFAIEGRLDPDAVVPGTFEMEWPRGSGRLQRFPELDRVAWFTLDEAADRIVKAQRELLTRLRDRR